MKNILQDIENKMVSLPQLLEKVSGWKAAGEKIVFTNGVFDLVHTGHITYLAKAAALGDKLIIGLNADSSVKRIKGPDRPVNAEASRQLLLAALTFTDAVVLFDQDTPAELIKAVLPDVLIKGSDYNIENIAGAADVLANGGEVKTITLVQEHSSTNIINKIKAQVR